DTANESAKNKIKMTAPVSMKLESEQINMTAPVSMQAKNGQWLVHFVMPEKYTLSTLPTPNNPAVIIREVPARNYAAIRFSGFAGPIKVDRKIAELMAWLKDKGITPTSEPEMARYDAPWVLPFLRRNEIMVQY
ncbi:MAG TPA: heme-binding protein, partial [Oceanospirillaceae bacterium]|nr:heme-binding protein [Oceanospirillaceae bacterium]